MDKTGATVKKSRADLMNFSKTATQSALSCSTSVLLLRVCSMWLNAGLCRDRTKAWAWISFTSSPSAVSTRIETSLLFPWRRRVSRRPTKP
ncbi:hypothetical protein AOLI_G00134960 [Acnodon oligacanthus]